MLSVLQGQRAGNSTDAGAARQRRQSLGLILLVSALLLSAALLRFCNLQSKVIWRDEVLTAMFVAGHGDSEVIDALAPGRPIPVRELEKFQSFDGSKSPFETVKLLAMEEPEHPPAFYLLARLWSGCFGGSFIQVRTMAAALSLLALPCAWWLGCELFASRAIAAMLTLLVAVSPLHLLYAQEGREYSLWIVTIFCSSAALLHALRCQTRNSWLAYSLSLAACLYTHLFGLVVACSHLIYVLMLQRIERHQQIKTFALSWCSALLAFSPWLFFVIRDWKGVCDRMNWTSETQPLGTLIPYWLQSWTVGLVDADYVRLTNNIEMAKHFHSIVVALVGAFVLYALVYLLRKAQGKVRLFICLLALPDFLMLAVPDLAIGGQRSITVRYLMPLVISVQLCCAYLLADRFKQTATWRVLTGVLLFAGILCSWQITGCDHWWNKSDDNIRMRQAASLISDSSSPPRILCLGNAVDQFPIELGLCRLLRRDAILIQTTTISPSVITESHCHWLYVPRNDYQADDKLHRKILQTVVPGALFAIGPHTVEHAKVRMNSEDK